MENILWDSMVLNDRCSTLFVAYLAPEKLLLQKN
ncbi:hypothetical protein EV648_1053 [Kribbella sp. VKM Ac-2568]|nr:hypothetical protein EV648_1053 [Kribbella sp. VKM Ac-2568]